MTKQRRARIDAKKKLVEWAKSVKDRDNYECVICKSKEHLNSHHLIPKEMKDKTYKFDVNNGITLCCLCHKYSYKISAHKHPIAFCLWLIKNKPEIWKWLEERCQN